MKLFNSMTQSIEEFKPLHEGEVRMYVCGPTVYNYPHIGNVRPIVVFDTLKRTLQAIGYNVKMVSNYTDVDDKIIKVAKEHVLTKTAKRKILWILPCGSVRRKESAGSLLGLWVVRAGIPSVS